MGGVGTARARRRSVSRTTRAPDTPASTRARSWTRRAAVAEPVGSAPRFAARALDGRGAVLSATWRPPRAPPPRESTRFLFFGFTGTVAAGPAWAAGPSGPPPPPAQPPPCTENGRAGARLFATPEPLIPPTRERFDAYVDEMVRGD